MNGRKLWDYFGITEAGRYHRERNLLCQDRIAYECRGSIQAIALVDGIGKTDKNIFAGERVAACLAQVMASQFPLLAGDRQGEVKRALLKEIFGIIEKLMQEYRAEKEEFASTLMAVGIDHETESYCAIHLGDGIIISREPEIRVLSWPENGFGGNETVLTISEHALFNLRVLSGKIGEATEFALISDGGYEMGNLQQSLRLLSDDRQFLAEAEDDRSFVCLRKGN